MPIIIGTPDPKFAISDPVQETTFAVTVLGQKADLTLRLGKLAWGGKVYNETFVLEIDLAHLYSDYAEAARGIAYTFCKEHGLQISSELRHWPTLQFIVFKPRE